MIRKFYIQDISIAPSIVFEISKPDGYIEITDEAEKRSLHVKEYKKRRLEGNNYVFNYTAQVYLDIVSGSITPTEAFLFEQHVNNLLKQIDGGHWLTAQNTNENLALSGIYNQARKDSLQLDINNYIVEKY